MKQSCHFLFIFFLVCFTSKLYSQTVPSYVPTNGLVGWWGFNGNAQDGSGNGNHGTVNGATLTTDRFGNQNGAYSFDGVDDYINVSDHPDLRLTNTDFTIAIWCKIHQYGLPNRIYISKTDGPGNTSKWILWNIAVINGGPSVGFHSNGSQGSFLLSYGTPQISEWHQVVVRKTGSILEIFNDAVFQVYSNTFQMQPSLSDIRIGGDEVNGGGHWHNGKLDDIGIWNRALTQQEITNLYNSQLPTQTSLCLPSITTNTPSSIGIDSVIVGGNITNDGGSSIVLRGVCYSPTPNPNMGNMRTEDGSGIGSFSTILRNLNPSTTYYVRCYAKNSQGVVVYGNEVSFYTNTSNGFSSCGGVTDIDGNSYQTVLIGTNCWTQSNLKVSKYRNGDNIPTGLSNSDWGNTTSGAYAIYNNDPVYDSLYGKLYNHYAVMDTRGLCPTGWHVATVDEIIDLNNYLIANSLTGGSLKSSLTEPMPGGWIFPNLSGNNVTGFSGLPAGRRHHNGNFGNSGFRSFWWTTSKTFNSNNTYYWQTLHDDNHGWAGQYPRQSGFSVRCLMDSPFVLPSIATQTISSITFTGAITGGNILSDGGYRIYQKGVVYSLFTNPTISDGITNDGSGSAPFVSYISNLVAGSQYFVRAYATNNIGTAYGNELVFRTLLPNPQPCLTDSVIHDIDGNSYNTIQIGSQCWTQSNLKVSRYSNGDSITSFLNINDCTNSLVGAYGYFFNDSINNLFYGKLYNHYAVLDIRGLCPTGWHVPSNSDWNKLIKYLDSFSDTSCFNCFQSHIVGCMLKSTSTQPSAGGWTSPNYCSTNSSGFNAEPGGEYACGGYNVNSWGSPSWGNNAGSQGVWWSSSSDSNGVVGWSRYIAYDYGYIRNWNFLKRSGLSVRCLRD